MWPLLLVMGVLNSALPFVLITLAQGRWMARLRRS